jgi:hypothetical protein
VSHRLDAARAALAGIEGFSDDEREVILALLKADGVRVGSGHDGWGPPLADLAHRAFTWSEFDRWHAFFTARGTFPGRWDGLQALPASAAPAATREAYGRRKMGLLLEWLDMLTRRTAELGHYTRQGRRVRIVRQGDGHRCPVCESFNARELSCGSDTMPPLHPGCRCVLMAAIPLPPHERIGTRPKRRSHLSA